MAHRYSLDMTMEDNLRLPARGNRISYQGNSLHYKDLDTIKTYHYHGACLSGPGRNDTELESMEASSQSPSNLANWSECPAVSIDYVVGQGFNDEKISAISRKGLSI